MNRRHEPTRTLNDARRIVILTVVLLAAFALRIHLIGDQNIWWDEGLAIWAVRQDPVSMTLWTASDVHPPIYFWLLQAWVHLAGESEFAARFISLICGLIAVAAAYPLGKALFGQQAALLGTILLAVSRFHIWWSQEMRMYIVATMWGVLSLYALMRWFRAENWTQTTGIPARQQKPGLEALLYVLATAAGLYTLYLSVTISLIENIFFLGILLSQPKDTRWQCLCRWVSSQLAILALFAPWLALALSRMRSWSVAATFDFVVALRIYATLLTLGISTYVEHYAWIVAPFFLIIGAAIAFLSHSRRSGKAIEAKATKDGQSALLLFLFLVVPPLVVYLLTQPRGLFYAPKIEARYLVLFAPAYYLLLAWSVIRLSRSARGVGLGALAFVAAVFIWVLPDHYAGRYLRDEHQTMVRIIATYAQPGDAVLLVAGNRYPMFGYDYERLPAGPVRPTVYPLPQNALQLNEDNVEQELAPLAGAHTRLWLAQVNAPKQDEQGLVAHWLDQHYSSIRSFGFEHNALTLYAPQGTVADVTPGNLAPQYALSKSLGHSTTLLGYDLPTHQFRPGDTTRLALFYSSEVEASIEVRLVDENGRVLEQREDVLPPANPVGRQQFDFLVYSHTPGGLYHFEVGHPEAEVNERVSFGTLRIAATKPLPSAGEPPVSLPTHLGDGIKLLGYGLTDASGQPMGMLGAGDTLTLDLYWHAAHKVPRDYTVFTHLVGQAYNPATAGPVWAGHDSQPLEGGYPTSQWFVGETVVDRHLLALDPLTPPGDYKLEVGMYLLETMARLRVLDAQGQAVDRRIVLGRFPVVKP